MNPAIPSGHDDRWIKDNNFIPRNKNCPGHWPEWTSLKLKCHRATSVDKHIEPVCVCSWVGWGKKESLHYYFFSPPLSRNVNDHIIIIINSHVHDGGHIVVQKMVHTICIAPIIQSTIALNVCPMIYCTLFCVGYY